MPDPNDPLAERPIGLAIPPSPPTPGAHARRRLAQRNVNPARPPRPPPG